MISNPIFSTNDLTPSENPLTFSYSGRNKPLPFKAASILASFSFYCCNFALYTALLFTADAIPAAPPAAAPVAPTIPAIIGIRGMIPPSFSFSLIS